MSAIIHFGTDGWRARLDGDFNEDNLVRVADAAGSYFKQEYAAGAVYVGYDARPQARAFARIAAQVIAAHGLTVKLASRVSPTPAVSWAVAHDDDAVGALIITGSHHPMDYLGCKFRIHDGGSGSQDVQDLIEDLIEPEPTQQRGPIQEVDVVEPYLEALCSMVDTHRIAASGMRVVVDPMYGAATGYLADMLKGMGIEVLQIHGEADENTEDMSPEPVEPWVDDCEQAVVEFGMHAGLVIDGDANRVGAVDEHGSYISTQQIMSLLMGHLVKNRGMEGRVAMTLSASTLPRRVARALGLRVAIKPIGFKHIYSEMARGDVLLGSEESGGIGVGESLPERDAMLVALLLVELIATTGKKLGELVGELEETFGELCYIRKDIRMRPEAIEALRTMLPGMNPPSIAGKEPVRVSHMDGLRLEFADESWLLIRPSGTETLVRIYAEAPTKEERDELIEEGVRLARGSFI